MGKQQNETSSQLSARRELTMLQACGEFRGLSQECVAHDIPPSTVVWVMVGTMEHFNVIEATIKKNPPPEGRHKVFYLGTATVVATPRTFGDVKPWESGAKWDANSKKWELNICKLG